MIVVTYKNSDHTLDTLARKNYSSPNIFTVLVNNYCYGTFIQSRRVQ